MAQRNVVWTRTADRQFVGVLEYWARRNRSTVYSNKLVRLVSERTKQIAASPWAFRCTEFKNTRIAYLGSYAIFYKIREEDIVISAFWDNRQDPQRLLEMFGC
ncbi:MAG: type II toxin-antitoxin system RelE/ParE family toxin [Mangrovibacterium sp.]